MKKYLFILAAALTSAIVLSSCNDSEGDYPEFWSFATVKTLDGGGYYFQFDDQKTAYPGDKTRIAGYEAKEGQRVVIYFNRLPDQQPGYDDNIALYSIRNMRPDDVKVINTQEELDALGNDRTGIYLPARLKGDYLDIEILYPMTDYKKHTFTLASVNFPQVEPQADEDLVEQPDTENYVILELRHNADGDTNGYESRDLLSFRLGEFHPKALGKKGVMIRTRSLTHGTIWFKVDFSEEK